MLIAYLLLTHLGAIQNMENGIRHRQVAKKIKDIIIVLTMGIKPSPSGETFRFFV